jgi:predicted acylesterase/phospholipase RssA
VAREAQSRLGRFRRLGSITAGLLARNWADLDLDEAGVAKGFKRALVDPIQALASETVDVSAGLKGVFLPGSVADRLAGSYAEHLFGPATLQDLPDRPRFVFNATNLQSGVLWRFSKPYMWDYRVGKFAKPTERLAVAVAASSAFPPFLSPLTLKLNESDYTPATGTDLQQPASMKRPVLSDGGVYDNLGLETAWKRYRTILVSDGGGHFTAKSRVWANWPLQARRVLAVIDEQVRALRKRQVIGGLGPGCVTAHTGASGASSPTSTSPTPCSVRMRRRRNSHVFQPAWPRWRTSSSVGSSTRATSSATRRCANTSCPARRRPRRTLIPRRACEALAQATAERRQQPGLPFAAQAMGTPTDVHAMPNPQGILGNPLLRLSVGRRSRNGPDGLVNITDAIAE